MRLTVETSGCGPGPGRPAEDAPLDAAAILDRLEGNRGLVAELVELFFEDYPGWLAEIRAGIRAGDAARLKLAAHTLRGAAGYFRPWAPYEAARHLEAMADAGDLTGAAEVCAFLEAMVQRHGPALRGLARQA